MNGGRAIRVRPLRRYPTAVEKIDQRHNHAALEGGADLCHQLIGRRVGGDARTVNEGSTKTAVPGENSHPTRMVTVVITRSRLRLLVSPLDSNSEPSATRDKFSRSLSA